MIITDLTSTAMLLCQVLFTSVTDSISHSDCIRCVCEVETKSKNCRNDGCVRDLTSTDRSFRTETRNLVETLRYGRTKTPFLPIHNGGKLKRTKRSCGPFHLDIRYYIKCGRPNFQRGNGDTTAFARCATNADCAKRCVLNYTKMYEGVCPGPPNCEIWSRIHFGHNMGLQNGSGCKNHSTIAMWRQVENCTTGRWSSTFNKLNPNQQSIGHPNIHTAS